MSKARSRGCSYSVPRVGRPVYRDHASVKTRSTKASGLGLYAAMARSMRWPVRPSSRCRPLLAVDIAGEIDQEPIPPLPGKRLQLPARDGTELDNPGGDLTPGGAGDEHRGESGRETAPSRSHTLNSFIRRATAAIFFRLPTIVFSFVGVGEAIASLLVDGAARHEADHRPSIVTRDGRGGLDGTWKNLRSRHRRALC